MSSLMKIKEDMTSFQLLEKINEYRELEYEYKVDKGLSLGKVEEKNKQATLLFHKDLLKLIRDEFEEEINEGKISPVEYIDKKGGKIR